MVFIDGFDNNMMMVIIKVLNRMLRYDKTKSICKMWSNLRPEIKGSRAQIPHGKIIIGTQIKHMPKIIRGKVKQNFLLEQTLTHTTGSDV